MPPSATDPVEELHPKAGRKTKACVRSPGFTCTCQPTTWRLTLTASSLQRCRNDRGSGSRTRSSAALDPRTWVAIPRPPYIDNSPIDVTFDGHPPSSPAPSPTWSVTLSITTRMGREMILKAGHKFSKHPPATRDDLIRQIRKTRFVDPLSAVKPDEVRGGTIWRHDIVVPRRPQEGVLKEVARRETGKRILRVRLFLLASRCAMWPPFLTILRTRHPYTGRMGSCRMASRSGRTPAATAGHLALARWRPRSTRPAWLSRV